MKNIRKKCITLVFLLLVVSLGILKLTSAKADNDYDYFKFRINDAYYGNFDSDGLEDDIRIIASISTDFEGLIISCLDIYLTPPSGAGYCFSVTVNANPNGDGVIFILTAYNTVTVPGWYYAEINGLFFLDNHVIIQCSNILFDPPTPIDGPGQPTIEVTVVD